MPQQRLPDKENKKENVDDKKEEPNKDSKEEPKKDTKDKKAVQEKPKEKKIERSSKLSTNFCIIHNFPNFAR